MQTLPITLINMGEFSISAWMTYGEYEDVDGKQRRLPTLIEGSGSLDLETTPEQMAHAVRGVMHIPVLVTTCEMLDDAHTRCGVITSGAPTLEIPA